MERNDVGKQTPPTFFKGPRKTCGGYRTWFAHLFGVKNERNEIFAFNLKMKKKHERLSSWRAGKSIPFSGLGKAPNDWCPRSVREVSPKIYSEQFRFRNYNIPDNFCGRFSFVVDDSLNLLTNLGPRRKSPWSRRIAESRDSIHLSGLANRANLPGWSIMLGWCSPFLPRCVKRGGNDPCWRAGRWLVG